MAEFIGCLLKKPQTFYQRLTEKILLSTNQQTRALSTRVMEDHYDLGNDLYENMLGSTMNYTCAFWKPETKTLDEAQTNKMDLVARKLKLKPGMKVLELGCGFGSAAKYFAENYKVSVVGYNISSQQVAYAREKCKGLDVTFHQDDYRNATGQYDAVYSIGILEHVGVKNHREYFEVCDRCLKPDGLVLVHTIIVADHQTRTCRWLNKYIFPGGELPYAVDLYLASRGLFVVEDVQSLAKSYIKTLRAWHKNFNANWSKLEGKYGGLVGGRFYRMWNFYLMFSIACFKDRTSQLHQVVYSKYGRKEEYYSVR